MAKDKENRQEDRADKKDGRRTFRLDKIRETTAKAYAVASKRKWLVFLIGAAIAAYFVFTKGGGGGGVLDIVKGFF